MIFSEFWKIMTAAWIDFVKSLTCTLLKSRLAIVNKELDGMKKYVESVNNNPNSTSLSKSFARYFEQKIPGLTAEREALEADLETTGCKEN